MGRFGRRWSLVLAGLWLLAPARVGPEEAPRIPFPAAPIDRILAAAAEGAEQLRPLYSLLVSRRGELLLERYFRGARAVRPANIKSASKSVLSALVGIAIQRGFLPGVGMPIARYFPERLGPDADPLKRQITIEDLLTMRAGLESTSSRSYGAWVRSRSWIGFALSRPMVSPPGERMDYSTGNTHLLSAILTRATGRNTWQFAQEALAEPLGFYLPPWPRDPEGFYFGGNDMAMTPRQMLAFGELYLNGGRAGGKQIVPTEWVLRSFIPSGRSGRSGRLYGYGWWIRKLGGRHVFYAWGYGGQFIFLVPELDLVVVTTSSPIPGESNWGHLGDVYHLLETRLIEPLEGLGGRGTR